MTGYRLFTALALITSAWSALAQSGPVGLNVSGQLTDATGASLTDTNVTFHLEIWDQNSSCRLYAEDQVGIDLSASLGRFSLVLGGGSNVHNYLSSSTVLDAAVFTNSGVSPAFAGCASGVSLASGDGRKLRLFYNLGGGLVALTPDAPIVSNAFAMAADTVQGKHAADFVQVNVSGSSALSQANAEYTYTATNWPRLKALLDGTSTQYLPTSPTNPVDLNAQRVVDIADPTAAQDAATKHYVDGNFAGKPVDVSATGPMTGTGDVMQWDGTQNKWVAGPLNITANGSAGGDLTGSYPNPTVANNAITSAKINSTGVAVNRLLITNSTDGTTVGFGVCTLNQVYAWTATGWACTDVSTLAPVTSVAGKTGAVSLNAMDISGLGSAALFDVGTAATKIPQLDASGRMPAVDGSQLTNVNAVNLQGRAVVSTAPLTNQVLAWNGGAWTPTSEVMGTVTDIESGLGLLGGPITAVGTLSVDVGTAPSKILQLNAGAQIPSVDGSLLFNVNAARIATRTVSGTMPASGQILGWNDVSSQWEPMLAARGSVINIATGNGLLGGPITTTGTLSIDSGTAASKILQLNAAAQIPPVDGSLVTGVNAVKLQARPVAATAPSAAQVLGWNNVSSQWEPTPVGAAASVAISSLSAATTTNSIENSNFAQAWNWSTATTHTDLSLASNALTYGSILSLSSTSASLNSGSGLLSVVNGGTSTSGLVARVQSNSNTGSGLSVAANGNVGVGTNAPTRTLDVVGAAAAIRVADPVSGFGPNLMLDGTASGTGGRRYAITSTTSSDAAGAGRLQFYDINAAVARAVIDPYGNLGIGTFSPAAGLDVATTGTAASAIVVPRDTVANRPLVPVNGMIRYASDTSKLEVYQNGSWQNVLGGSASSVSLSGLSAAMGANSIDSLNFPQAWSWSTATTQTPLSIAANQLSTGSLLNLSSSSTGLNSTGGLLNVANSGPSTNGVVARIQANGTAGSGLTVLANGNVGIGTNAPSSSFHLYQNVNADFNPTIQSAYPGRGVFLNLSSSSAFTGTFFNTSSSSWYAGVFSSNNFSIRDYQNSLIPFVIGQSSPTNSFTISSNTGNIGLGTATPAAGLDVALTGPSSSAIIVPRDTVANRPSTPVNGMIRYASDTGKLETYQNGAWSNVLGGSASSMALSGLTAATASNSVDSLNFPQTWNWSTATTQSSLSLSANTLTSGSILSISSSSGAMASGNGLLSVVNSGTSTAGVLARLQSNGSAGTGLTVLGNGNVGVNSASPAQSLDVLGNANVSSTLTVPTVSTTSATPLMITTGDAANSNANGNAISIVGGAGGSYIGYGGAVTITGGAGGNQYPGGAVNINGGPNRSSNTDGSSINLKSGSAYGTGTGGPLNLAAGDAGGFGTGGAVSISAGYAENQTGGAVTITSGRVNSGSGAGGAIAINVGASAGSNANGGNISFNAGIPTGTGAAGVIGFNNSVGIGTAVPLAALDVFAGTAASAIIVPRDTTANRPSVPVNGMIRYNSSLNAMETYVNGAWATIAAGSSAGSVVNIATGTGLLGGPITTFGTLSVDVGTAPSKIVQENANAQIAQANGSAALPSYSFVASPNTGLFSPAANTVALSANGNLGLTVLGNGNVGIGTPTPVNPLDIRNSVTGTFAPTGTTALSPSAANTALGVLSMSNNATSGSGATQLSFNAGGSAPGLSFINGLRDGGWLGAMSFGVSTGPSSYIEVMRMNEFGNVGIGSSVPAAGLDVATTGTISSALIVPRDTSGNRPSVPVNGMIRYASDIARFEAYQNGSWQTLIGSGTAGGGSALSALLAATGTNSFDSLNYAQTWTWSTATSQAVMTLSANGLTSGSVLSLSSSNPSFASTGGVLNVAYTGTSTTGVVARLQANGSAASGLTVLTNGNVGLNTTLPNQALDVAGNANVASVLTVPTISTGSATALLITTGTAANANANGNSISLVGGAGGSYIGNGGAVNITGGAGGNQWAGGAVNINGGPARSANTNGSAINLKSGYAFGTGLGGPLNIAAGDAGSLGNGGTLSLLGGQGVGSSKTGGPILIQSGSAANGPGGAITIAVGTTAGSNWNGGNITLAAGAATGTGSAGVITMTGNVGLGTTAPLAALDVAIVGTIASALIVPRDTVANRPVAPINGMIRYASDAARFEGYQNGSWQPLIGSGTAGGGSALSALTAATSTNTIDNTNFTQTWNWSMATSQTAQSKSANALTTGTLLSLTSSSSNLNSTAGLLNVANAGTSTSGLVARVQANGTAGSGLTVLANGNAGIGTSNPAYLLDLKASVPFVNFIPDPSQMAGLTFRSAGQNRYSLQFNSSLNAIIFSRANGAGVYQNDPILADASGNVSIGGTQASTSAVGSALFAGADGLVGIGTASPAAGLDIALTGTAASALILPRDTVTNRPSVPVNGMIRYASDTSSFEGYQNGSWQTLIGTASGGALSALTAATSANTISNANFPQTWNWSTVTTHSALTIASSNAGFKSTNGLLNVANTGTSTSGIVARVQANSTAGTGLTVLANGNVGIATTAPLAPLDVRTSLNASYASSSSGALSPFAGNTAATGLSLVNSFATINSAVGVQFTVGTGVAQGTSYIVGIKESNNAGGLSLGVQTGASSYSELLRLSASSNVGINSSVPMAGLDVATVGTTSSAIIVPRDTVANRPYPPVNGMIRYATDSSSLEAYLNGSWQNLTGGSASSLPLSGLSAAASNNTIDSLNFAQTWNWSTAATQSPLTLSANGMTTGSLLSLTSSSASLNSTNGILNIANTGTATSGLVARVQANSAAGSGLTVSANGNVGIGTSSPTYGLHLAGSGYVTGSMMVGGTSNYGALTLSSNAPSANGASAALYNSGGGAGAGVSLDFYTTTANSGIAQARVQGLDDGSYSNHLVHYTKIPGAAGNALSERMRLTSAGLLGIGTSVPAAGLDVATTGPASSAIVVPRDTVGNRPSTPVNGMIRYASDTGKFEAFQNGSWQNLIGGAGVAAISSLTAASAANTIDNTNYPQTWNWSTSTTATDLALASNALTTGSILTVSSGAASLNSSSGLLNVANTGTSTSGVVAQVQANPTPGAGLTVLANGNVGIATSAPANLLQLSTISQTTSTNAIGANFTLDLEPTGSSSAIAVPVTDVAKSASAQSIYQLMGHQSKAAYTGTGGVSYMMGNAAFAQNNSASTAASYVYSAYNNTSNNSTGGITQAYGAYNEVDNYAGTVGTAYGSADFVTNNNSANISNAIGHFVEVINSSSGTINTGYGVLATLVNTGGAVNSFHGMHVNNLGTNPDYYAFYSAGSTQSYFGGNVGVGSQTPAAALDVAGTTKLGSAGTPFSNMGACTVASFTPTTTATNQTCTGVPASTGVVVSCSASAAFSTPGSTALYARATGTASQIAVNTTVANSVAVSLTCMWMQP